jgi:hypothetical protein
MKPYLYSIIAAVAATGLASAQTTAYTDPVGYFTIPIPAGGTIGSPKLQIASQGMLPSDAFQYAGTATNVTSTYLEQSTATWTPSAYVGMFVEITNGPLIGTFTKITANSATQLTTFDNIVAAGTTPTFRIVKSFTIGTLLGNPPTAAVLAGATNANDADNFLILNAQTGVYDTVWYKNGGIGGTGWRASSTGSANAVNNVISPNDGMVFQRKQAGAGSLVVAGSVKNSVTDIWVEGDNATTKLSILSLQFPVDQLTLGASGLYTTNAATGVKGATNANDADNVLIFDAATGIYDTIWYKNGGIGGTGWRASSTGTALANSNIIPSGRAVLIQRKAGPGFTWNVPKVTIGN